eukprot:TRINITY_DN2257_c0_g1_i6.p3 TRINITY_DN2257_c0_g1~~TRINITY_DN2257_c0_g1_i6.p3  ORF type:complete len:138 (+),score=64.64 TRINITY_DN2257_c0_g1_i6:605-1018(+)
MPTKPPTPIKQVINGYYGEAAEQDARRIYEETYKVPLGKIPRPKQTKASKLHAESARTRMAEKEKERLEKLEQGDKEEPKELDDEELVETPKEDLFKMKRFRNVAPRVNTNLKKSPAKTLKEENAAEQPAPVPQTTT